MTKELKEEVAKHIQGKKRTNSGLAQIPKFDTFKEIIKSDVERAKGLLSGNLQEILIELKLFEEFQRENIGDLRSATESLIVFFCKKWNIEAKKLYVH